MREAQKFDNTNFSPDIKRQFKKLGKKPLAEKEETELNEIISKMGKIYGETRVCVHNEDNQEECHNLEPGLYNLMSESKDHNQLNYVWQVHKLISLIECISATKSYPLSRYKNEEYCDIDQKKASKSTIMSANFRDGENWWVKRSNHSTRDMLN